jgi:hypothetical protein
MSDKEKNFYLEVITPEIQEKIDLETISNLRESQKSGIFFKGNEFYLLGRGHSFGMGFFNEYITKSGIKAKEFLGKWIIDNVDYDLIIDNFVIREYETDEWKSNKINESFNFDISSLPVVKNIPQKTISSQLIKTKPKK